MEYILESVFEVGFERRGLSEAVAIVQLGNFASCQQQHSTHSGVLRVAMSETRRGEDITEKARRGPSKSFSREGV